MASPKVDLRAEPSSVPPEAATANHSVERVVLGKTAPASETQPREREATGGVTEEFAPRSRATKATEEEAPVSSITSHDPRFDSIQRFIDDNDWKGLAKKLGPLDGVGKLPPNIALLAALAHNESTADGDPESVPIAIRCMAAVLNVPQTSATARVLARRLLRKNPVSLRERQAPPAKTTTLIIFLTLLLGGAIGWLSTGGFAVVRLFCWRLLHHR